jgi:hypothetical protein
MFERAAAASRMSASDGRLSELRKDSYWMRVTTGWPRSTRVLGNTGGGP